MHSTPLRIGCEILRAPVALAPMAGITDRPFRALAARFGAPYVVSEMIASREMVGRRRLTESRADVSAEGAPAAVQLAGCEAVWMAEAARMAVDSGARLIDVNMGCPAKKVAKGFAGAALMRDPDHALTLIEAVAEAVPVPVTLKMRLGWDADSLNAPLLARRAESSGVRMIVVHGRTRAQLYSGAADWAAIRQVAAAVRIPVLANGDIAAPQDARRALAESGAAGVMIGRAARGAPWIVGAVAADLLGERPPERPRGAALAALVAEHYEAMLSHYGAQTGMRCARKHLGWWLEGRPGGGALRARLMREEDPGRALAALRAWEWPEPEPEPEPLERAA